jgi:DNA-binding NtrC family response regulator
MSANGTLLCWHSARHGIDVLRSALALLKARRVRIGRVLYLVPPKPGTEIPERVAGVPLERLTLHVSDPTDHAGIYETVRTEVVPRVRDLAGLHINVSPGTPAMHAVWLILHAGGAFPEGTRLWSSQLDPGTQSRRIDPVTFPISTYLAEARHAKSADPAIASYEPEARSPARRAALEQLARYARLPGAPLLILGERGTGKTRLVESLVRILKGGKAVVAVPCGGLDPSLAESALFGHVRGAFTGADANRPGLIKEAAGGILFLDEVQDLPKAVQRKLVRVLQDHRRRYRQVGGDAELESSFELVCASNRSPAQLRETLDQDLLDRISHLTVRLPPLRECREDLPGDWRAVWKELRSSTELGEPPWTPELCESLTAAPLSANLRDLQRLSLLCMAWSHGQSVDKAVSHALAEWRASDSGVGAEGGSFFSGSRRDRTLAFQKELATWAKATYGTWAEAAKQLGCDEKTLRDDAGAAVPTTPAPRARAR